jgi:hypothetical protein
LIRFQSRSSSGSRRGRTIKHRRRLIHELSPSRRRKVRLLIELRKRPFKLPADMLEEMTLCEEVFHTPSGIAFADVITDGHRETWPIRSKRFRTGVRRCYYQATGAAPGGAVIVSALDLLEARAQFDAPGPRG